MAGNPYPYVTVTFVREHESLRDVILAVDLNPYVTSYLRNVTGEAGLGYTDTFWIFQTMVMAACVATPLVGVLATRTPFRLHMLVGILSNA